MRFMRKYVDVGSVLLYETCDAIELDLNGNSKRINPHIEHLLVIDIRKEGFYLHNLDKPNTKRKVMSRGELNYLLDIGRITISDEIA